MEDLKLERLWLVYPGKMAYPMDDKMDCVPLAELSRIRETLQGVPPPPHYRAPASNEAGSPAVLTELAN